MSADTSPAEYTNPYKYPHNNHQIEFSGFFIRLIFTPKRSNLMKKTALLISLSLGIGVMLTLILLLGVQNSMAVAAPLVKQAVEVDYNLGSDELWTADPVEPSPHPILSDVRVRQAIAHCTDKDALIASVYPTLTLEQRQELVMDTIVPKTSWAYKEPITTYIYSTTLGQNLLDDAGWTLPAGADYRLKDGKELFLQLNTTDSDFRKTFLAVFEEQMRTCGIHVARYHLPGTWFYGDSTGVFVRDFEVGEFAWMSGDEPGGESELYACDQIPSPENGWTGQNIMGWCNQAASDAIELASDTSLPQDQRETYYATVIDLFAEDIPSLPLFLREGSTTWEHIDFNLETYAQDGEITPAGTDSAALTYTDYQGNLHTVTVPPGAVTETTTLRYYPLVSNVGDPPDNMIAFNAFRFNVIKAGVPQDTFTFAEPLTLTVEYNIEGIEYHIVENSFTLYSYDESDTMWLDVAEICPSEKRYSRLDTTQDLYQVHLCQLSEFGLFGRGGENVRMGVNYGLDEAMGIYAVGHTFWVTVTDNLGIPKAHAAATTTVEGTGPDFAWSEGFLIEQKDWSDPAVDILPGDQVQFQSDEGFTETVRVGTISAQLFPTNNTVAGTIIATDFVEPLEGHAGSWGLIWKSFTTNPDGSFFVDFSPDYDLLTDDTITVGYEEPDLDTVNNVFITPWHKIQLPLVLNRPIP